MQAYGARVQATQKERVVAASWRGPAGPPTGRAIGARGPCGPSCFLWALEPTPYPLKHVSGTSTVMVGYTALSRVGLRLGPRMEVLTFRISCLFTSVPRNLTFHPWLGGSVGTAVRSPVLCRFALRPSEQCPFGRCVRACPMSGVGGSYHGPIAGPWLLTGRLS